MKMFVRLSIMIAISIVVFGVIWLIGRYTIGSERIFCHIGAFATGWATSYCVGWIINKITDKYE